MGVAATAGRRPAGRFRPPGPRAAHRAPAGVPARALHQVPRGHPGAARPARGGRQDPAHRPPRRPGSPRPEYGPGVRPLLRRDARRRILPQGAVCLPAAGRLARGVRLKGLGGRAASPPTLLMGDLCLARSSRILAGAATQAVQIAFALAIEEMSAAAASGVAAPATRDLLLRALEAT